MNLYLVGFTPDMRVSFYQKWLETNSLLEINKHIMKTPFKNDICFPLLSSNDKDKLVETGKTILLFSDLHYFLVDVDNNENTAIIRHINIDTILN